MGTLAKLEQYRKIFLVTSFLSDWDIFFALYNIKQLLHIFPFSCFAYVRVFDI